MNDNPDQIEENEAQDDAHAHPKPRYEDVNIPVIVMLGTFSAIMTFVIICFIQGVYYQLNEQTTQRDWYDRVPTPQELIVVKQKNLRNGYFETEDGKIYISVDKSAEKLLAAKGDLNSLGASNTEPEKGDQPKADQPKADDGTAKNKKDRPEPPGPGPEVNGKSEPEKSGEKADPKTDATKSPEKAGKKSDEKKDDK